MPVYLELFHGRPIDPITGDHPDMDDWGTEGPIFQLDRVQITYASDIRLIYGDFEREEWLRFYEDMVYYNGMGYGDFVIHDDASLISRPLTKFDVDKATLPAFPGRVESQHLSARLREFGNSVLNVLTRCRDWNGDTLEEISTIAVNAKLASCDTPFGYFCGETDEAKALFVEADRADGILQDEEPST